MSPGIDVPGGSGPSLDLRAIAARAGWRVRGRVARGACPLCGSSDGAWGLIGDDDEPRVGCWSCGDWQGLREALGLSRGGMRHAVHPVRRCLRALARAPALDLRVDAEWLHQVYGVFAMHLPMSADQRRRILGRDRAIPSELRSRVSALLGPLPSEEPARRRLRQEIAAALRAMAPREVLRRVPELSVRRGDGYAVLTGREEARYFEPWRDEEGRTVALRAYMGARAKPKYLTSPGRWGPLVHFAFGVPREEIAQAPWLLTEGWMKAEVAAHALHAVVVGFPGVAAKGSWRRAIDVKRRLAPDAPTYVAFDSEAWTSRLDIAAHALELAQMVAQVTHREAGFAVWEAALDGAGKPTPKGIDDAIVSGRDIRLVGRSAFGAFLAPLLEREEAALEALAA